MTATKSPQRRQNRSKRVRGDVRGVVLRAPKAPEGLLPEFVASWKAFWSDQLATTVRRRTDLDAVVRLFRLKSQAEGYRREAEADPLVDGSTGQLTTHPYLKLLPSLYAEIRALEDRLGMNDMSRTNRGIVLEDDPDVAATAEPDNPHEGSPAAQESLRGKVLEMRR